MTPIFFTSDNLANQWNLCRLSRVVIPGLEKLSSIREMMCRIIVIEQSTNLANEYGPTVQFSRESQRDPCSDCCIPTCLAFDQRYYAVLTGS